MTATKKLAPPPRADYRAVDPDLPPGWARARLGDLADLALGKMLDREKRVRGISLPYLRNANVRWGEFDLTDILEMKFEEHELEKFGLRSGDLIVCEGGEPGRAAIWPGGDPRIKFQKALLRVRPSDGVLPDWLLYALRFDASSGELEQYFTGSTIKHFPKEAACRYELPIAPTSEQRRIVAKLDALLARVRAARDRLARVPTILKRFRRSVLAAASSGQLTEDWRASSTNPAEWRTVELREITDLITKGASPKWQGFSYVVSQGSGTLFITSENVREMRLDLDTPKYVESGFNRVAGRSMLRPGDLLTNIVGASIGRTAIYDRDTPANINQAVCLIRLKPGIDHRFVLLSLSSPYVVDRMHDEKVDVARANLNLEDVGSLRVELPPLTEQAEIVRRVEALFKLADAINERVAAATARADRLTQSILARALRGELVPQDPNDEPAGELLNRIRTERVVVADSESAKAASKAPSRRRRLAQGTN